MFKRLLTSFYLTLLLVPVPVRAALGASVDPSVGLNLNVLGQELSAEAQVQGAVKLEDLDLSHGLSFDGCASINTQVCEEVTDDGDNGGNNGGNNGNDNTGGNNETDNESQTSTKTTENVETALAGTGGGLAVASVAGLSTEDHESSIVSADEDNIYQVAAKKAFPWMLLSFFAIAAIGGLAYLTERFFPGVMSRYLDLEIPWLS